MPTYLGGKRATLTGLTATPAVSEDMTLVLRPVYPTDHLVNISIKCQNPTHMCQGKVKKRQ